MINDLGYVVPAVPTSASLLPDMRLDMITAWQPGGIFHDANQREVERGSASMQLAGNAELNLAALRASELWWVGEDAGALLAEIAAGVPEDVTSAGDLFPQVGMAIAEQPIFETMFDADDGRKAVRMTLRGIIWCQLPDGWACMMMGALVPGSVPVRVHEDHISPFYTQVWRAGAPLSETSSRDEGMLNGFRWLIALMALSKEPRLSDSSSEPPPRSARRRSQRAGIDLGATRVVYLRGSDGSVSSSSPEDRTYRHRWIVSGHWRSQPYGEGMKLRRPVYIAPYVKGPEGAPLLHGEKVRAVI